MLLIEIPVSYTILAQHSHHTFLLDLATHTLVNYTSNRSIIWCIIVLQGYSTPPVMCTVPDGNPQISTIKQVLIF